MAHVLGSSLLVYFDTSLEFIESIITLSSARDIDSVRCETAWVLMGQFREVYVYSSTSRRTFYIVSRICFIAKNMARKSLYLLFGPVTAQSYSSCLWQDLKSRGFDPEQLSGLQVQWYHKRAAFADP
jgi:hypothetical protein